MLITYNSDMNMGFDESEMDYVQRMCMTKDINKLSWEKLTAHLNKLLGYSYSESYYRKHFKNGDFISIPECTTATTSEMNDCNGDCIACADFDKCIGDIEQADIEAEVTDDLFELRKERVKLSDERSQISAYVRRISREETLKEIAHEFALEMTSRKLLPTRNVDIVDTQSTQEGILLLSDWHYGMVCDNHWNKFDPDICRDRVRQLLDRVVDIIQKNNIKTVTVLNLSDLIAGRIHTQIRIESRFDVITQTMEVSEILAEFLSEISLYCSVEYYDCLDNHSRLEPNKNDSMDLESLVRIIPWYLRERVADNKFIHINDNEFGADIITCNVLGHDIIGVHGDNDKPTYALERLSLMTHKHYDMLCTAHLHHFSMDETYETLIVSNASLMGVDAYSAKLRLTSKPSQTFIVVTEDDICNKIHRITLK